MFKFMKSKKGFSLVELMIVVVIMAILVAVAVPIYNSVTGNAREKTCIDNQRQILSTLTNLFMMEGVSGSGTVEITFNTANGITETDGTVATFAGATSGVTIENVKDSFKTIPVCGDEANDLIATCSENDVGTALVSVECSGGEHELEQNS